MTMLAISLAIAGGTQYEAGHFIDAEFDSLFEAGRSTAELVEQDIYLGYASAVSYENDPEVTRWVRSSVAIPFCGPLEGLAVQIAQRTFRDRKVEIESVVFVNASQQLRQLRDRAIELKLEQDFLGAIGPREVETQ